MKLNSTQSEHIGDHACALSVHASDIAWFCTGEDPDYNMVRTKYDECERLMKTIGVMLETVKNNTEVKDE